MPSRLHKDGFTLIELLVVIAIIAILAAILFPVFARAREKARQTTCTSNQRQIAVTVQMYAQDHGNLLPNSATVWSDLNLDSNILVCPTKGKGTPNGYGYNSYLSAQPLGSYDDAAGTSIIGDSDAANNLLLARSDFATTRHTNKCIVAYLDGHVDSTSAPQPILPLYNLITTSIMYTDPGTGTVSNSVNGWSYDATYTNTVVVSAPSVAGAPPALVLQCAGDNGSADIYYNLTSKYSGTPREWALSMSTNMQGGDIANQYCYLYNAAGAQIFGTHGYKWAGSPAHYGYWLDLYYNGAWTNVLADPNGQPYFFNWAALTLSVANNVGTLSYGPHSWTLSMPNSASPGNIKFVVNGNHGNGFDIINLKFGSTQ